MRDATNAGLAQARNQLAAQGSEVSLVDTSSIAPEDLVDGVQLNATGHAELAQAWFNAIQDAIPPPRTGVSLASADEVAGASAFDHGTGSDVGAAFTAHDFIV